MHVWRRSYDVAPPGGESLKDTAARVLPYYIEEILPRVLRGENVLVSAHGNSLRALIMVLERLSPREIVARELGDRRAADLPAQRRCDRGGEAGPHGLAIYSIVTRGTGTRGAGAAGTPLTRGSIA